MIKQIEKQKGVETMQINYNIRRTENIEQESWDIIRGHYQNLKKLFQEDMQEIRNMLQYREDRVNSILLKMETQS